MAGLEGVLQSWLLRRGLRPGPAPRLRALTRAAIPGLGAAALLLACSMPATPSPAAPPTPWKLSAPLTGKTKKKEVQPAADISGLACARAVGTVRTCLVVDDEIQGAQVVMLSEGSISVGAFVPLIDTKFGKDDKPLELDAEAVAYADDKDGGSFYVIGSYGRPRHEDLKEADEDNAKAKSDKHVFRIPAARITKAGQISGKWDLPPSGELVDFLKANQGLKDAFDQPLKPNGMSIEGLAVQGDTLFVGFRGPVLGQEAQIVAVPLGAVFRHEAGTATSYGLKLGLDAAGQPRGIRDLVALPDGFLVLAGPVNDPPKDAAPVCGDYAVYAWKGPGSDPTPRRDLDGYARFIKPDPKGGGDPPKPPKPEGLMPLDDMGSRALIVFDGPANGWPVPVTLTDKFTCPG